MRTNDNGIDREMTATEKAAHEAWLEIAAREEAARLEAENALTAARQSAVAKLTKLGLTSDEIVALIGA
jgi:hypothetical protein